MLPSFLDLEIPKSVPVSLKLAFVRPNSMSVYFGGMPIYPMYSTFWKLNKAQLVGFRCFNNNSVYVVLDGKTMCQNSYRDQYIHALVEY